MDNRAPACPSDGVALLERAISYTLGSLSLVTDASLSRATPCHDWDLGTLLAHMDDSLAALGEAADLGHVDLDAAVPWYDLGVAPATALRDRACRLLGAWTRAGSVGKVSVAGYPLSRGVVTATGAVEIAVHGWDVAEACGHPRPIPAALAAEVLDRAWLVVADADRPGRFAPALPVPAHAAPGDCLLAFLGRRPG